MKSKDDLTDIIADTSVNSMDLLRDESRLEMRRQAERIARDKTLRSSQFLAPNTPEEALTALHELQVHQIELEMQNGELRQTQVELSAARARYFDLYDLAPLGYITVSGKGIILESNITAAIKLGGSRGTLIKSPISRYIHKDDQDLFFLHRKRLFETGDAQSLELQMVRQDGTAFWARLDGMLAKETDEIPVYRFVMSDITERKSAEDALKKSYLENRILLDELQHRAKNGFSLISSMLKFAAASGAFPNAKKALEFMDTRVNSLSELYELLYSNGSFTDVRLDEYCARVASSLVKMTETVKLDTRMENLTVKVRSAAPIGIILSELITNAVKHAFSGSRPGTITLTLRKTPHGAFLEVADDGIGLPAGFDASVKTGLGLNLVKALSLQIDGAFRIEGGKTGTRCSVKFALAEDNP